MIRYREVLEEPLEFVLGKPDFKKNKKATKLAGLFTLGLAVIIFLIARFFIYGYPAEFLSFINPAALTVAITFAGGIVVVLFKLLISSKVIRE